MNEYSGCGNHGRSGGLFGGLYGCSSGLSERSEGVF